MTTRTGTFAFGLLTVAMLAIPGCRIFQRTGGDLAVTSHSSRTSFTPEIRTAAYRRSDANTADLYFSDLPESSFADGADLPIGAAGSILHIHFFLEPSAGNTPIDASACNVTFRHVVFAPAPATGGIVTGLPVFGVYGGGGFFFPIGSPGSASFGGSIRDGTHRLLAHSPGFTDALGPATLAGRLVATRDDTLADAMDARMQVFLRRIPASPKRQEVP